MWGRELLPILRKPKQETSKEVIPPERQTLPAITPPPNYPNMPNLPPPYKPPKASGGGRGGNGGGGGGGGNGGTSTPTPSLPDIIKPPVTPFTPYFPPVVPVPQPIPNQPVVITGDKPPYTRSGGGGGGYSYVEPETGKGYEVSPTGQFQEVIPKPPVSYTPVWGGTNNAVLQGFQSGSTFIPAEAALTPEGLYKPELVKFGETIRSRVWGSGGKPTGETATVTTYITPKGYLQETQLGGKYEWKVGTGTYGTTAARISETWKGEMIPGAETEATLSGELPVAPTSFYEKQIAVIGGIPESDIFARIDTSFGTFEREATAEEEKEYYKMTQAPSWYGEKIEGGTQRVLQAKGYTIKQYEKYEPFIKAEGYLTTKKSDIVGIAGELKENIGEIKGSIETTQPGRAMLHTLGFGDIEDTFISKEGAMDFFYLFRAAGLGLDIAGKKVEEFGERIIRYGGTREDILKYPIEFYGKEIAYKGAALQFGGELLPKDIGQAGTYYGISKAFKYAPIITKTAFGISGVHTLKGAETRTQQIAGLTMIAVPVESLMRMSLFGKKPYQMELTADMEKQITEFAGRGKVGSSRVFLETERGEYVLGKGKGGEVISFGGAGKPGESITETALRELKEETGKGKGLTSKDISQFKYKGRVVFPEETMRIFTAKISDKALAKIVATSDISKIVLIPKKSIWIKGATGQTALQPVSRISPYGRIRAYEAGIINWLETGKKPTALAIDTEVGSFFLGTQARYDVPYSAQKKFFKEEKLLLAHGTQEPAILRRYTPWEKKFKVEAEKTRRGQAQGLYVHPPTAPRITSEVKRLIGYTGEGEVVSLKESIKLPFKVPKKQYGYIGLSYSGFKTSQLTEPEMKLALFPKSTAYLFKESPSKIMETPKTISGTEAEFIIPPETGISTRGRAEIGSIGLRKVYLQPTKILEAGKKGEKTIAGIFEEGKYKYVTPSEIAAPLYISKVSESQTSKIKFLSKVSEPSVTREVSISRVSIIPSVLSVSKITEQSVSTTSEIFKPSISRVIEPYAPSYIPSVSRTTTPYVTEPPYTPPYIPPSIKGGEMRKRRLKQVPTFAVQIKRRGKFVPVYTDLTKGSALMKGSDITLRELARTFKITPTGRTKEIFGIEEFMPSEKQFRGYQVRKGKRIETPNQFIQRSAANLQSIEEKQAIRQAKLMKGILA